MTPVLPPTPASTCASKRGGDLDDGNAPHEDGGEEAGDVVDDAAAEGDHDAGAVAAAPHHLLGQDFDLRQSLPFLAAGEEEDFESVSGQTLFQRAAVQRPDVLGGDHKEFPRPLGKVVAGARIRPRSTTAG